MAKVIVRGISFNTKKDACAHFGINYETVKHRVRLLGIDFEEAIFLEKQDNSSDEAIKSHIQGNVKVDPETRCWNWQLSCFAFGYGQMKRGGKNLYIHRESYRIFNGPLIEGLVIRHLCNNPRCCNPKHLAQGTFAENAQDSVEAGTSYFHNIDQHGENNHVSKFTNEDAEKIRELYASRKYTTQEIADMFNVSRRAVERCISFKTFKNSGGAEPDPNFKGKNLSTAGAMSILLDYHVNKHSVESICEKYGQRKANILRIIRGDRFNSVFQRFKKEYLDVQEG